MAAPRKYPEELRERAIRMAVDARRDPVTRPGALQRVGEQLGINPETLRGWVSQAEIDAGERPGTTTSDAARLVELEREVKELRRSNAPSAEEGFGFLRGARPPLEVSVAFIDAHRAQFGVEFICRVLQVAPSSYYAAKERAAAPSAREVRDVVMMQVVLALWIANRKVHGADKLT